MARIAGIDLPENKKVLIALTYIYGIGRSLSTKILDKANVDPNTKMSNLSEDELGRIRAVIDNSVVVEGDLRKQIQLDIKRLMEIQSYRGLRHRKSLPVRGQRTHTNARTRKGPRRATIAKKKAPGKK
ncbi:30S ribosomal protein S13 [Chloracidobacterium aggregatum]|jgi:small subunit ribosomal protein S13|uniref:Small ribosomal subunit protein uS13 n=1 Tax=Chloracidobacterium sp. N TaxID=2821540 RepID=A0ABX8AXT2_9BACT|nr:30S ribosomal protein S13 [Chloracidobacterium aggregatum]QUV84457.1 30S ribosomal protein S13 [Chloracidobacterium sp. 2]QUV87049.1 30S ribosomal protein S13 [Chloracidobacterium sp. S]QUV89959.1 30S ribosomal protein S13 [Chloracidobacterium sp. A]QUV93170.1 30S ribosomal protein S13 [Chloracidobacterium sp. N]QUV96325.1 30S ribosomal protein S13 [Chloracidobacterium sp. E]